MTLAEQAASTWPEPFNSNRIVFLTFGTDEISMSLIYWAEDDSALILIKSKGGFDRIETSDSLQQALNKLKAKGGISDIMGSTFKKTVKYFKSCAN